METGNDLVAEPSQYSSDFGHSFKMKINEISLYFNGLRFHLSILPKSNYLPLCCYTGVAYCDMVALNREHLFTDDEGALWLKFRRQKTNTLCRVKLLSEAVRMIERYQSEERNTLFAPITYSAYLVQLKALQLRAGISIPLSAHVGRHTFATLITLERGVPIETVSRMLGHSNIQTTERYAHVTPKKLFDEFGRFLSFTENLTLTL